jgi:Tol biopolymer transport system component
VTWFQDGTKLLVSGPAGPNDRTGIWVLNLADGSLTKLLDDAWGAVLSPDNSSIAFRRAAVPELWIAGVSGGAARRLLTAPPGCGFTEELAWSPDGTSIAFELIQTTGREPAVQTYDLKTGRISTVVSNPQLENFCWAPDGRLIFSRREDSPNHRSSNLWEVNVDVLTGQARGKPRRLTRWSDFRFGSLSPGLNGRRLSFVRGRAASNVHVGELRDNTRLINLRRLTFDEWVDWPTGWTRYSTAVLYHSDRNGVLNIFQQALSGAEPEAIVPGQEEATNPRLSPDGRWILYLAWRKDERGNRTGDGRLMRVSPATRKAEVVFPVAGYDGEAADEQPGKRPVPSGEGNPRFRCPSISQSPCVLSEKLQNEMVFTAFDPLQGRKRELARFPVDRARPAFWDLSSDGQWIAFGITEESGSRIQLLSLTRHENREIPIANWNNLVSIAWAPDGKALFLTGWASKNSPLLRVSLDGGVQLLYSAQYYVESPVPSPDGRYLAFGVVSQNNNAWLMDNLR